jgi:hypothetical protein
MVNMTHFKVLLRKNFLTLKRKFGFAMFIVLLPIISMGIFTGIKYAISDGIKPEGHNFDRKNHQTLTITPIYNRFVHDYEQDSRSKDIQRN